MSFAIKNALIAVPALVTLLLGITFIILVFVLVIRAISIMPLLRKALKIYVIKNSAYSSTESAPNKKGLWKRITNIFSTPKVPPKNHNSNFKKG